jgi:hypothetical protein
VQVNSYYLCPPHDKFGLGCLSVSSRSYSGSFHKWLGLQTELVDAVHI